LGLVFAGDPAAPRMLAVIGDPAAAGAAQAALQAAQDAPATGQLVVLTTGPGLTGLFASLHAEQPSLAITVLRVPPTADGPRLAQLHARAEPGAFQELVISADGTAREPVLTPCPVTGSAKFPLGPTDVALVSRSSGTAALALAQVLACCGAAVAVIGQPGAEEGSGVVAGLEELRLAGARVAYEVVNLADPADIALGVQRIERRLGPVTAIAHAVGAGAAMPVAGLSAGAVAARLSAERGALRGLLDSVNVQRLRLILTFGSVAARYGLPGQGLLALASAALADQAEAAATRSPEARALHIDLPGWAGAGLRGRPDLEQSMAQAGMAAISPGDAARLLLKILATPKLPDRVAVHGRVGVPGPAHAGPGPAGPRPSGRFLREVVVHYPGIELVCDARLSLASDPYLADYRVDGQPVLPPVLALEALAEAASALAGRPLRRATAVTMGPPVTLPAADSGGEILVRACALADDGKITATLRCGESGLIVDHVRAEFGDGEPDAAAFGAEWRGGRAAGDSGATGSRTAGTGMVDGGELYGTVCFQTGRFRRIAGLPELTAQSCRALARGCDDRAWFPPAPPGAQPAPDGLLLGSPGLNDAVMQALQACVPDRRVWPAACASITFSGAAAFGEVEIRAVAAVRRPAGPAGGTGAPTPASSRDDAGLPPAAQLTWDVAAVDSIGQVLVAWQGVRLREAGRLPRAGPWPLALLPAYLESSALRLGLDPDLRITATATAPVGSVPQPRRPEPAAAGTAGVAGHGGAHGAAGPVPPAGAAEGLVLDAGGAPFAACGWALADPRHPVWPAGDAGRAATFSRLCSHLSEPPVASAARLQAAAACLARAGAPADALVRFERATGDGWAILAVSDAWLASTVVEVTGLPGPVAIAIMTKSPRPVLRGRPVRGGAARRWS